MKKNFKLVSPYKPTGDQPQAIEQLVKGFQEGNQCQTLLGVIGSGETLTMANVIQQLNKPTLIIAHNKTLAAHLYGEFKEFFRTMLWSTLSPSVPGRKMRDIWCFFMLFCTDFVERIERNGLDDTRRTK